MHGGLLAPAHPRSRGENRYAVARDATSAGSSPLTRGKHSEALHGLTQGRLIPAHAGKTCRTGTSGTRKEAHPRSRGENGVPAPRIHAALGSSPLTRGKRNDQRLPRHRRRLIPAHAGKTTQHAGTRAARRAHPRSRGENITRVVRGARPHGSSPLTRGKLHQSEAGLGGVRLIPAHAGKTDKCLNGIQSGSAHPRSRGEN